MVDVNNLVDSMTSQDFSSDKITGKVEVSYYYCSAIFGEDLPLTSGTVGSSAIDVTDTQQSMAVALLAQALLIEGRKTLQARDNPNIRIRTTDELFTREMRNMLLVADDAEPVDASKGIMWDDTPPTESWNGTRIGSNL